jgi:hypothetical protein
MTNTKDEPRPTLAEAEDEQAENPGTETSTDRDEWVKKHGGRPEPVADVADADGSFVTQPTGKPR